jgi:hypothetical protein
MCEKLTLGTGNQQSYSFTAKDIFWGELGGCLEAIDAGTTTLVDHAHMTYSPEHGRFLLLICDEGLLTCSSIKCVVCDCSIWYSVLVLLLSHFASQEVDHGFVRARI